MTGLRAAHAHKPADASAYFRAAEPVPSLLFSLSDISGLIQGFAREKDLFRGLFRLSRFFFIFFYSLILLSSLSLLPPPQSVTPLLSLPPPSLVTARWAGSIGWVGRVEGSGVAPAASS
jgi:hypothetical protein